MIDGPGDRRLHRSPSKAQSQSNCRKKSHHRSISQQSAKAPFGFKRSPSKLSVQISAALSQTKPTKPGALSFAERQTILEHRRQAKLHQLKVEKQKREVTGCTFKPSIGVRPKKQSPYFKNYQQYIMMESQQSVSS